MSSDKKTIGLTPQARTVLEKLMQRSYFRDQMDAAKFAMSFAINSGLDTSAVEGTDTTWNVGSFDPDGELRNLLPALLPSVTTPYRAAEALLNVGLAEIGRRLEERGRLDLVELMNQAPPSSAS